MGKVLIIYFIVPYVGCCLLVNKFKGHNKVIWKICHLYKKVINIGGLCFNLISLLLSLWQGEVLVCMCVCIFWLPGFYIYFEGMSLPQRLISHILAVSLISEDSPKFHLFTWHTPINAFILFRLFFAIQAHLGDTAGLVPGHLKKANITIKQVTQILAAPSAYKSNVYTVMSSIKCAIALCLKHNVHTLVKEYFITKMCLPSSEPSVSHGSNIKDHRSPQQI